MDSCVHRGGTRSRASAIGRVALVATALCATASLPTLAATQTVTNTVAGIQWQLLIDTSANTVRVGPYWGNPDDSTGWKNNDYAYVRAIAQSVSGVDGTLEIPAKFRIGGTDYDTTGIGNRAFIRCKQIKTLVLPLQASTMQTATCAFYGANGIADVVLKGPATVLPGETQSYNTLTVSYDSWFSVATAVKRVLVGPNVKLASASVSKFKFGDATDAVCLLPATSVNTTWSNVTDLGGTDGTILRYGLSDDRTAITYSTADAAELIAFIDFAPLVKEYLGLDTRLSVTNSVALTEEQTTVLSSYGFDALSRVTFVVDDATQYANTVAAVPGAATLIADPANLRGATLSVPSGRKVVVPLPKGGKYSTGGNGTLRLPRETN